MKRIRILSLLLSCALLFTALAACGKPDHDHVPGPAATCTTPQTCTICGEVLVLATGHTPAPISDCEQPQTCSYCERQNKDQNYQYLEYSKYDFHQNLHYP